MEDVPSFVFDFFVERHIILKEEWLSNVLIFLFSFFEADIVGFGVDSFEIVLACVNQPLILQIASVVDIGASFYSQFCALVHEFVDNTGFEPLPDMEHGPVPTVLQKPRRMLSFTVSDGETILRAIEYHSIKSFSLLTKPGCKILLIPPILCRKGVFFLKPTNVQLLGDHLFSIKGIVVDIVNPLRIVDDLWTMKVTIQDVSFDNFTCIIDNSTLSSLIGLTPKEAIEIRASSDMNRRQDAQRRLAAVEEQLRRLDLLLDVELFSGARADPIIRNIRTLMQALDVL
uniref:RecQ-mediated genome instability protein 1 n=1 Tax=Angiostrongylus cantonensis TaxID=6313 RepID=A0A158PC02_ANGCA